MVNPPAYWYCSVTQSDKGNGLDVIDCSQYSANNPGLPYSCTGHRNYNADVDIYSYLSNATDNSSGKNVPGYIQGSIIENEDINEYRHLLSVEIERRKQHIWYKTALSYDKIKSDAEETNYKTSRGDISSYYMNRTPDYVKDKETIDVPQRNILRNISFMIRQVMEDRKDFKESENDFKPTIKAGNITDTGSLSDVGMDLFERVARECICYSDCTNFRLYYSDPCPCQGYYSCGCNYG